MPPPRVNLTRYHGVFAPRSSVRRRVVPAPPPEAPCHAPAAKLPALPPPLVPVEPVHPAPRDRVPWAELLKRTLVIDVLTCPRCDGRMRVLAYLTDPDVTAKILDHLGLPSAPPRLAPARDFDQISDSDVQKLKASMANRSPKTVNNVLTCLNTLLKCAVRWGVISRMPATLELLKVPLSTEVKFYEPADYERLVEAARAIDHRIHLFVLLGGDAGLRCGEIIALEQPDVDLRRGVLSVRRSEWEGHLSTPKSGRERKINLTIRLKQALTENRHLRCDRVLWRDDGFPGVTQVLLAKWMCRAQRKAGLKVTGGIHVLRHTFCSRLAMAGAPTKAIQELAGHEHLTTTQRYMHLSPAAKLAAITLLDQGLDRQGEELREGENCLPTWSRGGDDFRLHPVP